MVLLKGYTQTIPYFGSRALTLDDLYELCESYGIYLLFEKLEFLHGCSFFEDEDPFIVINSYLTRSEQVIAGYHEFVHLDRHVYFTPCSYSACAFESTGNLINLSRMEYEAQAVGLLALMPDRLIRGMNHYDIMFSFDVNLHTALYRLSLPSLLAA